MTAHDLYKLIEAASRLLLAGGEIIDLGDGRRAIALPVDVHEAVLTADLMMPQLEREVMAATAMRLRSLEPA